MNITLTPQQEEVVLGMVASGRYKDANAVMSEALRLMEEEDRYEALRAAVAAGYEEAERGELIPWTPELMGEIKRQAAENARNGHKVNPLVIP